MNLPGLGDLGRLYGLPAKLRSIQEELAGRTVDGAAGGGLVTATASGTGELRAVRIDPELLRGDDREMIADLVTAAVNDALAKARELAAAEMQKALGGLLPPGLAGLPGMPGR
ncbi:MAG TPA: YbaB/EbfC family nucleoid-associated protein [Planctomycetota bacterium]|nr:YbaB/EbfC family nucleoid-associated protein [Planctomycetota bacterium]